MYYILTSKVENDRKDAILSGDSRYLKRINCSFTKGITLPAEDILTPIIFKIEEYALRGTMTDHLSLNDIKGPVFSIKLKTLLEKAGVKNLQYFQLTLRDEFPNGPNDKKKKEEKNKKPVENKDYFIANEVGLADCVDHENSVFEYFYPAEIRGQSKEDVENPNNPFLGENLMDIDMIKKLVIDETKIDPSLKIFRLKDQSNLLVFHKNIVDLIKKEKLTGFVFVPVEKYTDAIPDDEAEEEVVEEVKRVTQAKPKQEPPPPLIIEELSDKKKGRFDSLLNWKKQDK